MFGAFFDVAGLPFLVPLKGNFVFLALAYFAMAGVVKYIDEAFDSRAFNRKLATILAPIILVFGLLVMAIDAITAVFVSGYIIGVIVCSKVNLKEYFLFVLGWLFAIFFLGIIDSLIANLVLLILFTFLTVVDEKANDYSDAVNSKKGLSAWQFFLLRSRLFVLLGTIALAFFSVIRVEYIACAFSWLLAYNGVLLLSERTRKN